MVMPTSTKSGARESRCGEGRVKVLLVVDMAGSGWNRC
jgi:hypothetical protein